MSILQLPVETACRIFSFSVHAECPPFTLPGPEFEAGSSKIGYISPDDIASVCRRWREIALSDSSIWSTLFLSLDRPTDNSLRRAIKLLDHCLERSGNMPFSCFIIFGFGIGSVEHSNHHLALRLLCTLLEHQKRWRDIEIRPPNTLLDDLNYLNDDIDLPYFMLRVEDLGKLGKLSVGRTHTFRFCGLSLLPSLTSLELYMRHGSDAIEWLLRSPSIEKLHISAERSDGDDWDSTRRPATLAKLRYLKLDTSLSSLQLLDCPVLEDLSVREPEYEHMSHFHNFISRCPPLNTLRIQSVWGIFDQGMREYLAVSLPRNLSCDCGGSGYDSSAAFAISLFKALSEKRGDSSTADSSAFLILPELESLELIDSALSLADVLEFIVDRWNAMERRLKLVKVVRCSVRLSPDSNYSPASDPAISSVVYEAVRSFTDEGFSLEIA